MGISAVVIDSREPTWVQRLTFGGVPTVVDCLEYGDLQVLCDDGATLIIERKTPDDFLGSLDDNRVLIQAATISKQRQIAQLNPKSRDTIWPYLVITGTFMPASDGKTITQRGVTGWKWRSVMGALLSIQEMGTPVVFAADDADYEKLVISLSNRSHKSVEQILPPKLFTLLSPGQAVVAALPGIGIERLKTVMIYANDDPARAIAELTDPDKEYAGIPKAVNKQIRSALKLQPGERLEVVAMAEQ
ncbi:MAG: ERCC4 domain-containing protein [Anaerolineaceae bacterium]|nr:ERCC4 domain-containing protein [Anaerolineaceae bacterium]